MIEINLKPNRRHPGVVRSADSFAANDRAESTILWLWLLAVLWFTVQDALIAGLMAATSAIGLFLPRRVRAYLGGLMTGRRGRPTKMIVDEHGKRLPRNSEAFLLGMESAENALAEHLELWPWLLGKRIVRLLPIPRHVPVPPDLPKFRTRQRPSDDALNTLAFRFAVHEEKPWVRVQLRDATRCEGRLANVEAHQLHVALSRRGPPIRIVASEIHALEVREVRSAVQGAATTVGALLAGAGIVFAQQSWWLAGSLGTVPWLGLVAATFGSLWYAVTRSGAYYQWERLYDAHQLNDNAKSLMPQLPHHDGRRVPDRSRRS